jgi:hypothetical protein
MRCKDSCDAQILTRIIFYSLVYECIRESQPWAGETPHEHEEGRKQIRQAQSRARGAEQRRQRVAFQYDYGSHPKVTRSKIDKVCEFCRAKKFRTEPPGKVKLDTLNPPPEPLLSYMLGRTSESKPFLQNIRRYNSCFQMTSCGTRATGEQDGGFMPTFKVKWQIYHKVGALLPFANETPREGGGNTEMKIIFRKNNPLKFCCS